MLITGTYRIGCLWFALIRVFAIKTSRIHCPAFDNFLALPLMSGKSLWEARTREEWEYERDSQNFDDSLLTFGELMAALKRPEEPAHARKLDAWEVGADKLGMMMNIAVELAGEPWDHHVAVSSGVS